jgi:hypothetical protein
MLLKLKEHFVTLSPTFVASNAAKIAQFCKGMERRYEVLSRGFNVL